jgi:hypothetical protein
MRSLLSLFLLSFVLSANAGQPSDSIPPLNVQVLKYVESVIGKKVDRGECWDLANQALTRINADWDHQFKYGKLLDPEKDPIYPGDIIQFKNVKVEYQVDENTTAKETMGQHTAIVYKVNAQGDFMIAHQNTGFSGRKVGVSQFKLNTVKKGKYWIYRPIVKDPINKK